MLGSLSATMTVLVEPDGALGIVGLDEREPPAGNPHEAGQPAPITGYRRLTRAEVDAVNRVKAAAETIGHLCADDVAQIPDVDKRWLAKGQTALQEGFMFLNRAITRPTTF